MGQQNKVHERNMGTHRCIIVYLCSDLWTYLWICVKERTASLHVIENINISFWQIWHFDIKGTGWVGLQLGIVLMKTVGRFDM